MKSGLPALAMIIAALPLVAAASPEASDAKRLRRECIDDCRIAATSCATRCVRGDCIESCTRPLDGCINNCRKAHPPQTR